MITLHPNTQLLIVVDVDGVLFDHTWRDDLMPPPAEAHRNEAWLRHQDPNVVKLDATIDMHVTMLHGLFQALQVCPDPEQFEVTTLTSRLECNREATLKRLDEIQFGPTAVPDSQPRYHHIDRAMSDERPAPNFKADILRQVLRDNRQVSRVLIVEDNADNLAQMVHATQHVGRVVWVNTLLLGVH